MSNGAGTSRDIRNPENVGFAGANPATKRSPVDTDPVNVVVIPDSFKGTLSARDVARAMSQGIAKAAASHDIAVNITEIPFADGGEGTLDAVLAAWGTDTSTCDSRDALGRPLASGYGISPDGSIGLVEAAQANGLAAVSDVPLRPREASTRGVGRIVHEVLERGVEELLLTVGGSATTDGGTGLLRELGARFLDEDGVEIPDGGGALTNLATIDFSGLEPAVWGVRWKIAVDVTNPLTGPRGAAHVFGPQKGADQNDVAILDAGLVNLARVVREAGGKEIGEIAGLGAAGGIAAILYAFFDVELIPGWELVSEALNARELVAQADLVLTGEGRFDSQSIDGKVIHGVRQLTPEHAPLVVIAGGVDLIPEDMERSGVTAAYSICPGPITLEEVAPRTAELVERMAYQVGRLRWA